MLDASVDLDERLDGGEARLPGITAIGGDPIDDVGGCVGADLDTAMAFFDGGFGDELGVRSGAEIADDVGFESRLVALEREEIVGLMGDDLVGDRDLTAHGIDGDERAFELFGCSELIEQIRDSDDLVGLFGDRELRKRQAGVFGVGRERMQGFSPVRRWWVLRAVLPSMAMRSCRAGQSAAIQCGSNGRTAPDRCD